MFSLRSRWQPVLESGSIIALKKDGASISLEPGGQFELVVHHFARSMDEAELQEHLKDLEWLEQEFPDLDVLWAGFQPKAKREDISWMPKGRYKCARVSQPGRTGSRHDEENGHRPGESGSLPRRMLLSK